MIGILHKVRRRVNIRNLRRQIKRQARLLARQRLPVKLEIGAAVHSVDSAGWIATNLPELNALDERQWRSMFRPSSVDRVLAEHVVEHWTPREFGIFLRIVKTFLAPQGFLRLAVPDGCHPDPAYIEYVKPGGSGAGAEDHKILYTYQTLTAALADAGFVARGLEFFDEGSSFNQIPWSVEDGLVRRSAEHDTRNVDGKLAYTSLIVDAMPAAGA